MDIQTGVLKSHQRAVDMKTGILKPHQILAVGYENRYILMWKQQAEAIFTRYCKISTVFEQLSHEADLREQGEKNTSYKHTVVQRLQMWVQCDALYSKRNCEQGVTLYCYTIIRNRNLGTVLAV